MSATNTARAASQQRGLTPWKPGQSGNPAGRVKGTRNKLSEAFVSDLYKLWLDKTDSGDTGGVELLRMAAKEDPVAVVKVVASLVPKDFNLNHEVGPNFRALWEALAAGKVPAVPHDEGNDA